MMGLALALQATANKTACLTSLRHDLSSCGSAARGGDQQLKLLDSICEMKEVCNSTLHKDVDGATKERLVLETCLKTADGELKTKLRGVELGENGEGSALDSFFARLTTTVADAETQHALLGKRTRDMSFRLKDQTTFSSFFSQFEKAFIRAKEVQFDLVNQGGGGTEEWSKGQQKEAMCQAVDQIRDAALRIYAAQLRTQACADNPTDVAKAKRQWSKAMDFRVRLRNAEGKEEKKTTKPKYSGSPLMLADDSDQGGGDSGDDGCERQTVFMVEGRRKPPPCHFFSRGNCRRGNKCGFEHGRIQERRPTRQGSSRGVCYEQRNKGVCRKRDCPFDHDTPDRGRVRKRQFPGNSGRGNTCFDFDKTGSCRRGDRCRYQHVDPTPRGHNVDPQRAKRMRNARH